MPSWKRNVGRRLGALIERTVPDVRKATRWNSPFYGLEGQGALKSYHCCTKAQLATGSYRRPPCPAGSRSASFEPTTAPE